MMWANCLRRWTMRGIHALILGASLIGASSLANAQPNNPPPAAATTLPRPEISRELVFKLPMNMTDSWRSRVSEFRLYTRTPNTPWKLLDSGPKTLKEFTCRVPQDGEYWYSLMTIDVQGKATPPDVTTLPPSQRVIVDTTPPVIQVEGGHHDGEMCLRCKVQDANADPSSLRAVYKTATGEIPLEAVAGQPGLFKLKGADMIRTPVIVTAADQANNVSTKEVNLQTVLNATLTQGKKVEPAAPGVTTAPLPLPLPSPRMDETHLPAPRVEAEPHLPKSDSLPKGIVPITAESPIRNDLPSRIDSPDRPGPFTAMDRKDAPVAPSLPPKLDLPTPPPLNLTGHASTGTEPAVKMPATSPTNITAAPEPLPRGGAAPHQLINTTHASVEYRFDQVGPSGIGKVEIYMTPDKGQTWLRLGEDPDKRSPAELNLPGDGLYGIRIVLTNGNGFGGAKPARGDAPDCEIEVDTTSPFIQVRSAELIPSSGLVEIRWNATDRNFGNTPINLYYRTRVDASWQVIARGLKNDGVYRWAFPRDNSSQFLFKVEATDLAGNLAQDVTRQPLAIDVAVPRATVVGVTGSGTLKTLPNGSN